MNVERPSLWLLGPVCTAFLLFALSHRTYTFPALCLLAILAAYGHPLTFRRPGWQQGGMMVGVGLAAWVLCGVYYGTVLNEGGILSYFWRPLYKPWMITTSCMMLALVVVWMWHLSAPREPLIGGILTSIGLLAVTSGNFLSLSPAYLPVLALFCGATLLTLVVCAGGERGAHYQSRRSRLRGIMGVAVCLGVIGGGSWAVSATLRQLEHEINGLIDEVFQPTYSERIGVGNSIHLARQRRVALSRTVVATIDGASWPGYLRTQVMTDYRRGRWTSDNSIVRPVAPDVGRPDSAEKRFSLFLRELHLPKAATWRPIRLLLNLRGAVPLPYGARRIATADPVAFTMARGGVVQTTQPGQLREYRVESHSSVRSIPSSSWSLTMSLVRDAAEADARPDVHRALAASDAVLQPLRQLAHGVVGTKVTHPLQVAQVLQNYFRRYYTYALDVQLGTQGDPIVDFVLHRRPAYCEYYASGLALMLRALDIPARVVGGFAVKEYNALAGQWIVRQRDAHAWTEVFDAASGKWVAFDATPAAVTTLSTGGFLTLIEQGWAWLRLHLTTLLTWFTVTDLRGWLTEVGSHLIDGLRRPGGVIGLGFVMAMALWLTMRRRLFTTLRALCRGWRDRPHRNMPPMDARIGEAQRLFHHVTHTLAEHGLPIGNAETVEEYLGWLRHTRPGAEQTEAPTAATACRESLISALQTFARSYAALRFHPQSSESTAVSEEPVPHTHLQELQQRTDQLVLSLRCSGERCKFSQR